MGRLGLGCVRRRARHERRDRWDQQLSMHQKSCTEVRVRNGITYGSGQPAHEPASAQSTRGLADGLHTAVPCAGFSIEADPACKAGCAQAGGRYLPSVHPLHRAANLTDHTPVVPQSDADVHEPDETSSPGRGVMVGFCSRPPLSPARRRRACLAGLTHGSRGASCYKPLRHHQSAHSRPHIYAHHTRAHARA